MRKYNKVFLVGLATGVIFSLWAVSTFAANKLLGGKAPKYPQNECGHTYGSAAEAATPGQEPELIAAVGVDGTEGYVYASDLCNEDAKTPEEALAQQQKLDAMAAQRSAGEAIVMRTVPLYAVDGKTVIGDFAIVNVPNPNRCEP